VSSSSRRLSTDAARRSRAVRGRTLRCNSPGTTSATSPSEIHKPCRGTDGSSVRRLVGRPVLLQTRTVAVVVVHRGRPPLRSTTNGARRRGAGARIPGSSLAVSRLKEPEQAVACRRCLRKRDPSEGEAGRRGGGDAAAAALLLSSLSSMISRSSYVRGDVTSPSSNLHRNPRRRRRRPVGLDEQHLLLRRFKPLRRPLKLTPCR
jgi:hypothetical protein